VANQILRSADIGINPLVANAIDRLATHASSAGLFFDFDGVLSPIQDDPEAVQPLPGVNEILQDLARRVSTVAVLSSRPASFLWERFANVHGVEISGLYGLEKIDSAGNVEVAEDAKVWLNKMKDVLAAARDRFERSENAIRVEDKKLSVALHYRTSPHLKSEVEGWADVASSTWGVAIQRGRQVIELKPELKIKIDKGSTLSQWAESLSTSWYCGDDLGDIPALLYIRDRKLRDASFSGLTIGVGNDTIVDEVFQTVDIFMESPETLRDLLRLTLNALS
jgi:trehalose 6-phosphate phosphatase